MFTATCHCGAVSVDVPRKPEQLTSCNCSICRRYGTLWAYYGAADLKVHAAEDALASYAWGDKALRFLRCATCGCITHWEPVEKNADARVGVNARNLPPECIEGVRVRRLDGAASWKYLD